MICPDENTLEKDSEISHLILEKLNEKRIIAMYRSPLFHIAPPLIATKQELEWCFDGRKILPLNTFRDIRLNVVQK